MISIHAPARGATFGTLRSIPAASLFQSTLPRGERLSHFCRLTSVIIHFNPRSREGSDSFAAPTLNLLSNFNPRSREGSDAILSRDPRNAEISIHAPARGATMQAQKRAILQRISIHAPARGATYSSQKLSLWCQKNFNPRSREGSDVRIHLQFQFRHYFNPRSREGSDCSVLCLFGSGICISIHAPARGATALPMPSTDLT